MKNDDLTEFIITDHARKELKRRDISVKTVERILMNPQQRKAVRKGRDMIQSQIKENGKIFLIRIFVDVDRYPVEVVTAYKTSKIKKYWEEE